MRSSSDLAVSISLIRCNARVGFFAVEPQMHLRGKDDSDLSCHFEYKSRYPRHGEPEFYDNFCRPDFVLSLSEKNKVKELVASPLHSHFSQFLLFSESTMMMPNFLNHCVIRQALVVQVDNQQRFREYPDPFVYLAAFWTRGWALWNSRE